MVLIFYIPIPNAFVMKSQYYAASQMKISMFIHSLDNLNE